MQRPPEAGVRRLGDIQPHHAIVSTPDHTGSAIPPRVGVGDTGPYTKTEPCRQYGVDDRASDDVVDVIQPEANHRHSNGDRQCAIAEPNTISDMGSDSACGATVCWTTNAIS